MKSSKSRKNRLVALIQIDTPTDCAEYAEGRIGYKVKAEVKALHEP